MDKPHYEIAKHLSATDVGSTVGIRLNEYDASGTSLRITPRSKLMAALTNIIKITIPELAAHAGELSPASTVEFVKINEDGSIIAAVRRK